MKSHTSLTNMDDPSSQPQEPSTSGPSTTSENANNHKRTPSGGLSKLAILRASAENNLIQADSPPSPEQTKSDLVPKKAVRAMAAVVQQQKTRRRKGSLRKAALLGRGAQREKNQVDTSPLIPTASDFGADGGSSPISPDESSSHGAPFSNSPARPERPRYPIMGSYTSPRASPSASPSSEQVSFSLPGQILSPQPQRPANPNTLKPSPPLSYTTSDDEPLSFASRKPPSPAASSSTSQTSYFGNHLPASLFQRHSTSRLPSPLSHPSHSSPTASSDTWDYSTTAFWGYVILIITWLVFVVGMGSCFEVWSWAWDVGETPYAPPELEDDPTLPITGYYPALIVMTAVMAWVWVVVAWVGMKYFRHARISGD